MSTNIRIECDRAGCATHCMANTNPNDANAAIRKVRSRAMAIGWMCNAGGDRDYCPSCLRELAPSVTPAVLTEAEAQEAPHTKESKDPGTIAAILCEFCERATPFFDASNEENRQAMVALLTRAGWVVECTKSGYPVSVCPCCHNLPEGIAQIMSDEIKELNAEDPQKTTFFPH